MLDFAWHVALVSGIYAVIAISLNLQVGVTGLLNFGQAAFVGLGAYATGILVALGAHWSLAMVAGMAVAALVGALLGRMGRTLSAEYWAIATLAVAELIRLVALNESWLTGGPGGIGGIPRLWGNLGTPTRELVLLATVLACVLVCYLLAEHLTKVQFGRILRMIRDQPLLAMSLGHDVVGYKMRIMALSAAMAAFGGSLLVHYVSFVGPEQLQAFETFIVWTMVVAGGLGNHRGVVLGALLIQLIYVGTRFLAAAVALPPESVASLRVAAIGLMLLAVLLFRPDGALPEPLRRVDAHR